MREPEEVMELQEGSGDQARPAAVSALSSL